MSAPRRRPARCTGLGLITAIFLLVILSSLGAAIVTITTAQQASSTLDEQGARAYQAARAGIEWGLFQQINSPNSCSAEFSSADASFAMPAGNSLSGYTVSVTCSMAANTVTKQIIATACNQPDGNGKCPNPSNNGDYIQRAVQVVY